MFLIKAKQILDGGTKEKQRTPQRTTLNTQDSNIEWFKQPITNIYTVKNTNPPLAINFIIKISIKFYEHILMAFMKTFQYQDYVSKTFIQQQESHLM